MDTFKALFYSRKKSVFSSSSYHIFLIYAKKIPHTEDITTRGGCGYNTDNKDKKIKQKIIRHHCWRLWHSLWRRPWRRRPCHLRQFFSFFAPQLVPTAPPSAPLLSPLAPLPSSLAPSAPAGLICLALQACSQKISKITFFSENFKEFTP